MVPLPLPLLGTNQMIAEMGVRLWHVCSWRARWRILRCWGFAAISQLQNEGHCAAKWHSCAKIGLAAAKYPAEWSFGCEIGNFHALELRSCETAAKWGLLCWEVALVCQNWFRSCENFRREGPEAANWFRSKVSISQRLQNLADSCFSPVFALFLTRFCSERLSFNFFAIPPDFDHPKTYITSKQIRIKALKSKLKHWKQN